MESNVGGCPIIQRGELCTTLSQRNSISRSDTHTGDTPATRTGRLFTHLCYVRLRGEFAVPAGPMSTHTRARIGVVCGWG